MEGYKIAFICVAVFVVLIVIIIIGVLIYKYVIRPAPPQPSYFPLNENDVIRFSFLMPNNDIPTSYYNLVAKVNNQGSCATPYNALVLATDWTNDNNFVVNFNPSDKTKFSLKAANNTFCYLLSENGISYISFGKTTPDESIWFGLTGGTDGNYSLVSQNSIINIITLPSSYNSCYAGQLVNEVAYIAGIGGSLTIPFYITNLTHPIPPAQVTFPFGDNVALKISPQNKANLSLSYGCPNVGITFTDQSQSLIGIQNWLVKLSPDKLAFALYGYDISIGTIYILPIVKVNNIGSYVEFSYTGAASDYTKGDYSSWFTLYNGNQLVSLLTNMSVQMYSILINCENLESYNAYGTIRNNGTPLTMTVV